MPLFIRTFLLEQEFTEYFNTVEFVKKTLICFNLEDETPLWKLWGYAYNNPRVAHAEIIVLGELANFLGSNHIKEDSKYKITLYATYSPCLNCCEEICKFFNNNKEKVIMNLKISKFYNFHDYDNKISLKNLKKCGVDIKMMDLKDYNTCFHHFVDPVKQFHPCEELDIQCKRNKIELNNLWSELDNLWSEEFEDYLFRRKRQKSALSFASEDLSSGNDNNTFTRQQIDNTTPKKDEQESESQAKTPVKLPLMKDMDRKDRLKRKLSFD